ncbi:MAG TPA: RNA polymerase sigma factor, partial [Phycisphaerales bacterium]|nr:RNA polymerase sigma factor [Phycisphaerales bacterium]
WRGINPMLAIELQPVLSLCLLRDASAMIAAAVLEEIRVLLRIRPRPAVTECQAAVQPVSTQSDEALIEAHLAGDEGAFETLVSRYIRELVPYLARVTGSRATADDVFQEAFLQVHQSAHTFDLSRRFKPWLYTIAVNKARDWHRRQSRRRAVSLSTPIGSEGEGAGIIDLIEGDSPIPTEGIEQVELASRVRDAVDSLPHHLREIILLSYFQKMSYNQIAETLQVPLGTVKSRLHAAVASFAQAWTQSSSGEEEAPA